jgi:hypothetical protein
VTIPDTKAARCETLRQAERWDINRNKAAESGLCDACAAQYAWGLADGFSTVRPPCPTCAEVVDSIGGKAKPSGWRVLPSAPGHSGTRKRSGGPQISNRTPAMGISGLVQCRRCGESWTGFAACHCSACHHTFTSVRAFDQHRIGTYRKRRCTDPATVGLVKIRRPHWTGWGYPPNQPIT